MPELPEVETMVRGLRPALLGRKLRRVEVLDPFLLHGCPAEDLARHGRGATVSEVVRRGKWVVVTLAGTKGIIVIQPRMTGGFWLTKPDRPDHIRLVFHVEKPRAMVWFCDTRRLGKIGWYRDADEAAAAFARSHGPDALEIGRDELAERLKRTARGIKPTLMDQKVLAGIGNIYADEILHASRIHPERAAGTLSASRARPAAPGDRRGAGHGDPAGGLELRRRLSDRPRPGRGLPGPELRLWPRQASLPGLLATDRENQDRRPDRPADLLLPALPEEVNRLSYFRWDSGLVMMARVPLANRAVFV